MSTTAPSTRTQSPRQGVGRLKVALVALGALVVLALAFLPDGEATSAADDSLPSPMGGTAQTAPGEVSGSTTVGPLEIADSEVAMGPVPLDVTFVPSWTVTNPTGQPVGVTVGQPQVIEGCCPGPVIVDDAEVLPGDEVVVPANGSVEVYFPLQMHEGMDGVHHLAIPLGTPDGEELTAVEVTGDFTADATI